MGISLESKSPLVCSEHNGWKAQPMKPMLEFLEIFNKKRPDFSKSAASAAAQSNELKEMLKKPKQN